MVKILFIKQLAFAFFFLSMVQFYASAQVLSNSLVAMPKNDWVFEENKGQLADSIGQTDKQVLYYCEDGLVKVYCFANKIRFVFTKIEPIATDNVRNSFPVDIHKQAHYKQESVAMEMQLVGANPKVTLKNDALQSFYKNYYLSTCPSGITHIQTSKSVVYKNIYPGIDMLLNCMPNGFKYSFTIKPGAHVADIKLKWNGAEISQSGEGICYKTLLGSFTEGAPYSYTEDKHEVACSMVRNSNEITFVNAPYNASLSLTIDPVVVWSTYYGGKRYDDGKAIALDKKENVYTIGTTNSISSIASTGVYQTSGGPGNTPYFAKFDKNGKRLWATYYGGSADSTEIQDLGEGILADSMGNVYVCGMTTNKTAIASSGAWQSTPNTWGDGFLGKFDSTGARTWGTYCKMDQATGIKMDHHGNLVVIGNVSYGNGIASSGAYQTSQNLYNEAAFVSKFTSNGGRIWGTYLGLDITYVNYKNGLFAQSVDLDSKDNIIMGGFIDSDTGWSTKGVMQKKYGGGIRDGFVVKMDSAGTKKIWATYLGDSSYDVVQGVVVDKFDNICLLGLTLNNTYSPNPAVFCTPGAWQPYAPYGWNMPVIKLKSDGTRLWGTFMGGAPGDFPQNITTDTSGNIYLVGQVERFNYKSPFWISACPMHTEKNADGFVAKFNNNGKFIWSTSYGGSGLDIIKDIKIGLSGNIFVVGNTGSTDSIATSGASSIAYSGTHFYYSTLPQFGDAFIAKFSNYVADGDALHGDSLVCSNSIHSYFLDKSRCKGYKWIVDSGSIVSGINTDSISVKWTSSGVQTIICIITDYRGKTDTLIKNLRILTLPVVLTGAAKSICIGDSLQLGTVAVKGNTYSWKSNPVGFSSYKANPYVKPQANTEYILTVSNAAKCSKTDSVAIKVNLLPKPVAGKSNHYCKSSDIILSHVPKKGHSYRWSSKPDIGINSSDSIYKTKAIQNIMVYLKETIDSTGCNARDSLSVFVDSLPKALVGRDTSICKGNNIGIGSNSVSGNTYDWISIPKGFRSSKSNPLISPDSSGYYYLTETISATGCKKRDSVQIVVNTLPNANAGIDKSICYAGSTVLGLDSFKGHIYSWQSIPKGFSSVNAKPEVKPLQATSYVVTEVITATGCSKNDTVNVKVAPELKPNAGGNHIICRGDKITLGARIKQKGHSYLWESRPGFFMDTTINPTVKPDSNSTYLITETISDTGLLCFKKDSAIITVHQLPNASAGPDTMLCYNQIYTMQGKGGISYTWIPATYLSSATDSNAKAQLPNTQRYVLVVANKFGCSDSSPVLLKVRPKIVVKTMPKQLDVCYGQSINLSASGSGGDSLHYQFSWPYDKLNGSIANIKIFKDGWHKVLLTDNCTPIIASDSVYISLKRPPVAKFNYNVNGNIKVNKLVNFINKSQNATAYYWLFDKIDSSNRFEPQYAFKDSGIHKIILIAYNSNGCGNDTTYSFIHIVHDIFVIAIPNIFSPNGDGLNDVFNMAGTGYEHGTFQIYNRWGEHIFQSTPARPGWDGTFEGKEAPEGVYLYSLDVLDLDNEHHYLSGNVTLIR